LVCLTILSAENVPRYLTPAVVDLRPRQDFNPLSQGAMYQGAEGAFAAQNENALRSAEGDCIRGECFDF
jgi:hypothetical protein